MLMLTFADKHETQSKVEADGNVVLHIFNDKQSSHIIQSDSHFIGTIQQLLTYFSLDQNGGMFRVPCH